MANAGESGPWTVGRLLQWTAGWFAEREVEGGRLAAELLLAKAMGCRKLDLYTRYESEPSPEQRLAFRELVRQAGEHTPVAYLLGTREFFSLEFEVTPAVLVPRPETEVIVQRMVQLCREQPERTWKILDLGTGSGCIAVAIAKYAPNAQLTASDVSAEALQVAARNVERHALGERIRLVEADWLELPGDALPEGGFDAICSNPPYISEAVFAGLPPNVRDHEPRLALSPGGDGLGMYRRLALDAPRVVAPGGRILAEMGYDQRDAVLGIFAAAGWAHLGTHRDPTDPHDRAVEMGLPQS